MIKALMAKVAMEIMFKFVIDSTFLSISRQRLEIGDEARLKQPPTGPSQGVIKITAAT